jgi:hypothetical protein
MQLTDRQIEVIGQRLPEIQRRAKTRDPRIHAVGIGKKIFWGEFTEDDAIVFFVVEKGTPPNQVNVGDFIEFVVDGESLNVDTDIVEAMIPKFSSCSKERPVMGGNCVATAGTGLSGSVGGAIVALDKKTHYLVSAAHLLTDYGTKSVDADVIQPSDDANEKIGKLSHTGPEWPAGGGDMDADAALARIPGETTDISYDIAGIGTIAGTQPPKETMVVLVSGAETNAAMKASIDYVKCTVTVVHQQRQYTFRNVFKTKKISRNGDSGALAIEEEGDPPRKVVGLLFAHTSSPPPSVNHHEYTLFADVMDCIEVLAIAEWYWGKPPA